MSRGGKQVFIVGAARSGTTFVQSLLSALPGFYSCAETHFFDELMPRGPVCGGYQLHRPRLELPVLISEAHLLEALAKADAGFLKIPVAARAELRARSKANRLAPGEFLSAVMDTCSPAGGGKARWVEKTPIHASYLRQIFQLFPDAQVVCVCRDPAGVLASAVSTFGIPASVAALDYYRSYRDVMRFLAEAPERARQIHLAFYDKIVASDQPLEQLVQFLGVKDAPAAATLRQAAKAKFEALYGDSAMKSIQPGMAHAPAHPHVAGWRRKSIEGFAGLLNRGALSGQGSCARAGSLGANAVPVALDLLLGAAYLVAWRVRFAASRIKQWLLGRPPEA